MRDNTAADMTTEEKAALLASLTADLKAVAQKMHEDLYDSGFAAGAAAMREMALEAVETCPDGEDPANRIRALPTPTPKEGV